MTTTYGDRFDIGRVIQRMVGVLGRNAAVFVLATLLLSALPRMILGLVALSLRTGNVFVSLMAGLVTLVTWLVIVFSSVLLQGALIFGTVSDINGRRPDLGEMLHVSLRAALPLIGVGLLVGLGVALGMILLIVPGVILALMWCVAAPVQVVEGPGVLASLGRSRELTRGHRWMILVLMIVFVVVAWVVSAIVALSGLAATGFGGLLSLATQAPRFGSFIWFIQVVFQPLVGAFETLIAAAGVASLYYELRTVKEGAGAETLAAAFA
jgi:MFS family permease